MLRQDTQMRKKKKEDTEMPFIDSKISMKLSEKKKDALKDAYGKSISILNKPEEFLMVGIEDGYDLYMAGAKLELGAYVSVSLFGDGTAEQYENMTQGICRIMEAELGIPANCVYVTYHGIHNWGWNGTNF